MFLFCAFSLCTEITARDILARSVKFSWVEASPAAPEISYTVSMSKPWSHLLEVEMHFKWAQMPAQAELKMPVWTPGSYLIREYARHVQDFAVRNANGKELNWRKTNKNTWQIDTTGSDEIVAAYRVYANELTVRTNELNDDHAFWNSSALLMFPKDQLKISSTLRIIPYGDWKIATALAPVTGRTNTFRAENFDNLYDSPFEVGNFKEVLFTVEGKPHRMIFSGEGNYDPKQIATDVPKIVEEAYKIFGELPYDNYTFIVNLRGGGNGLEHMNSTALEFYRFGFKPDGSYKGFLSLVAHEYFHAFNVKRIRPDVLGPFDYENENYTKLLWLAEGGTEYYSGLLLRRAGLITDKDILGNASQHIQRLQTIPGRFETSLEDASFDAWIKGYRPDENSVNNQISYYEKGAIVAMLLDLTIRVDSGGTRSLDDVLRYLYKEFYKKDRNYAPQDLQKACELMAGHTLDDFFSKYVRGKVEIDYGPVFKGIGLDLQIKERSKTRGYTGLDLSENNGVLSVNSVTSGTPAYDQGINARDQVIAVDGYRASQSFLQNYLVDRKPGDKIRLTIFRFDKLREIDFTLGTNERKDYSFTPLASPTDKQKQLYRDYIGAELN